MAGITGCCLCGDRIGTALRGTGELPGEQEVQVKVILVVSIRPRLLPRPTQPPDCPCNFFQSPAYVSLEIIERSTNMNTGYKQLTRSTSNRMIAGVCAGLGEYLNIDPTIVRLLAVLAFFTGFGGIAIVYLIMALIVPEQANVQPQ